MRLLRSPGLTAAVRLQYKADEELQLVPPIFSKIDIPQDYSFKQVSPAEGLLRIFRHLRTLCGGQTPSYSLIYTKAA